MNSSGTWSLANNSHPQNDDNNEPPVNTKHHKQSAAIEMLVKDKDRENDLSAADEKSNTLSSKLCNMSAIVSDAFELKTPTTSVLRILQADLDAITVPITAKKYILFDLDNTIIDSELLAFQASAPVANRILASKGVTETYDDLRLLAELEIGVTFKTMVNLLAELHNFSVSDTERKLWAEWEEEAVIAKVALEGKPCKGVATVIEKLLQDGTYEIAIVSSSSLKRMHGCLDGVGLRHYFLDEHIFSANSSLPVPSPKPEPDIYEFALEQLGISAEDAVAVEDSIGGIRAAVGAGIDVIGYVGCNNMPMQQYQLEYDFKEEGAFATMYKWTDFWEILGRF